MSVERVLPNVFDCFGEVLKLLKPLQLRMGSLHKDFLSRHTPKKSHYCLLVRRKQYLFWICQQSERPRLVFGRRYFQKSPNKTTPGKYAKRPEIANKTNKHWGSSTSSTPQSSIEQARIA